MYQTPVAKARQETTADDVKTAKVLALYVAAISDLTNHVARMQGVEPQEKTDVK